MSYIMNVCRGGKLDVAHFATSLDANEVAFQDIFMQFYPLVYSVALRATADPIEAEDVAQEVFLRLFRRWPALVIKTSLSAWLTRVALNLSFNSRRSRNRRKSLAEKLGAVKLVDSASAEEESADREERRLARAALLRMRSRDRSCLVARHSGLSYQEVAEVLGVRTGSVGTMLSRAEERFRKEFSEISKGEQQ